MFNFIIHNIASLCKNKKFSFNIQDARNVVSTKLSALQCSPGKQKITIHYNPSPHYFLLLYQKLFAQLTNGRVTCSFSKPERKRRRRAENLLSPTCDCTRAKSELCQSVFKFFFFNYIVNKIHPPTQPPHQPCSENSPIFQQHPQQINKKLTARPHLEK